MTSTATVATYGAALAGLVPTARARNYGELVSDPAGILDLPAGFTYRIVETAGDTMSDGLVVPGRPDGMACFEAEDGTWVLMRNHEISAGDSGGGAYPGQPSPPEAYDDGAYGGVTRVVIDPATGERISSNLVLTGTIRNCAGGMSPWGWLSCEEEVNPSNHGYVFLCPIDAASVAAATRIDGYGRFNHEAACVDPATNVCYLTEDRGDSCLYRFVPDDSTSPFEGRLQALKVVDVDRYATTNMTAGDVVDVEWVDIDEPTPPQDTVRDEAQDKGAAIIVRGEGIWFHDGEVYICSTSGGGLGGTGQIFKLIDDPVAPTLECVVRSGFFDPLEAPDNITISPWGQLFMAEDGAGENYVRALTRAGEVVPFARNALSGSELAGVCFSPDGSTMFVNIQGNGLTLAITGPFPEVPDEPGGGTGGESGGTDGGDGDAGTTGEASTSTSGADGSTATGGNGDEGVGPDDGSSAGAGSDGAESGAATAGTAAGTSSGGGTAGTMPGVDTTGDEGCGCTTSGGPGVATLAGLAALALGTRRRPSDSASDSED